MAMQNPITVDTGKCIGCSLCVQDCPTGYLYLQEKKAKTKEAGCISCGHCFAICPQNAVIMNHYDTSDCTGVVSMDKIDSEILLQAMKSRRSIRQFQKTEVEQEKVQKILEAGRYCPTAENAQNVAYTILGGRQNDIEKECVRLFQRVQKLASPFVKIVRNMTVDDHFFFKEAPLVIVVSSSSDINAGLASSYMELMAESLGLGVLFSGFFEICCKISPKIRRMLELPKGHKVVSCMVIGYPAVTYRRIVPRKPLQAKNL